MNNAKNKAAPDFSKIKEHSPDRSPAQTRSKNDGQNRIKKMGTSFEPEI